MLVIVETIDQAPKQIDHHNDSDRIWLNNFIFWAMRNGVRVTLRPIEESES